MIDGPHWFADVDRDWPEDAPARWQPCLETGAGHVPCFDVWFPTRESCEDWIRDVVIGAELERGLLGDNMGDSATPQVTYPRLCTHPDLH